jgi:WD40 repeat protein
MQTTFTLALNSFRAQFKADGSACAIITDNAVQLYAFEHPSGRREFAEDLGSRVNNAVFSADGHWVAASGGERLAVWDLAHAGPGALVTNGADTRLYFSSQGELFGSRDDHCFRWHLKESSAKDIPPRVECVRLGAAEEIASLCLVSNQLIFTGPQGTCVSAPEPPAQAEQRWVETVRGIGGASPDARWLGIYQPYSSRLYVYQLPGLETVATLTNRANISGFDFSPSGEELAVGSIQGVELWNTATWTRTRVLTNSLNLLYTPDGRSCWVTRDFRRAELCDARSLEVLLPLPPGMHPLAVSPDGRYLAASTEGRRLQLWDITQITATLKELGLEW